MDFKQTFKAISPLLTLFGLAFCLVFSQSSIAAVSNDEIQSLESDFLTISNKLYVSLSKTLSQCRSQTTSLKRLNLQIEKLLQKNKNIIAICLTQNHLPLIKKNIDSKEVFPIFQFLLDVNNFVFANKLYTLVKDEGDKTLLSNYSFMYARYYLKRKKWNKVLAYTKGIYNDLAAEDANFARLMTGIALQKTKKHRTAIKIYSKIPQQSKYFAEAK